MWMMMTRERKGKERCRGGGERVGQGEEAGEGEAAKAKTLGRKTSATTSTIMASGQAFRLRSTSKELLTHTVLLIYVLREKCAKTGK